MSELRAGLGSTANKARQLQSNRVLRVRYGSTIRMRHETATTSYNLRMHEERAQYREA